MTFGDIRLMLATAFVAVFLLVAISGCGIFERWDDRRDNTVDAVQQRWCKLTDAEKEVLAERRNYSEETIRWLESRCK